MRFKIHSGTRLHWSLGDAMLWRMQWGLTAEAAFKELARICRETPEVLAIGVLAGSNPVRPRGWDF